MSRQKKKTNYTVGMLQEPDANTGLTKEEVSMRMELGKHNGNAQNKAKSYGAIFRENILTLFNLLNVILAILVISTGYLQNALFMGVCIANVAIGIFQQIRSKISVEKLSLLSKSKVTVLREGIEQKIDSDDVVLHDILILHPGNQVPADVQILSGTCEVNESLLTGEADVVYKEKNAMLLSGSFIANGNVKAIVRKVGEDSYAANISNSARYIKKVNSEILNAFNTIIKFLSIYILIIGVVLLGKQIFIMKEPVSYAISSTVAAVIGMIPEGLVLLTNMVLAVSVMRLASRKILVQEMYCIETLARVNVLCVDKTGTITKGEMHVSGESAVEGYRDVAQIAAAVVKATGDSNGTAQAITNFVQAAPYTAQNAVPFSPIRKWSAASFENEGTYVMGAPDILLAQMEDSHVVREMLEQYQKSGARTVLLAHSWAPLVMDTHFSSELPLELKPVGVLALQDSIREEAQEIFSFLDSQEVNVKVISGDSGRAAFEVAKRAGIQGIRDYVDTFALSDEELKKAAITNQVFGRVTPEQKKVIVEALKENGDTVAMTGDGINDVLALKEADCSIAVASGSDAARTVAQIVLMDSNLYSIYDVIMEGRRTVNNINKSASLFLIKTLYSCLLGALFIFLPMAYPFMPIQLSLISSFCVGIPSFLLALPPNQKRVKGKFLGNVLKNAFPGALCVVTYVVLLTFLSEVLNFTQQQTSTVCVIATGLSVFYVLGKVSWPLNWWRGAMMAVLIGIFVVAVVLFKDLLFLASISGVMWIMLGGVAISVVPLNLLFTKIVDKLKDKFDF